MIVFKPVETLLVAIILTTTVVALSYFLSPAIIKWIVSKREQGATPGTKNYVGLDYLPEGHTVLFVTAHPDDLEWWVGGTLPKLIARHNEIHLAILTDGGKENMPIYRLFSAWFKRVRRSEALAVAEQAHITGVYFINYQDGGLVYSEQAVQKVEKIAQRIQANDIFTLETGRANSYYESDHNAAGLIGAGVAQRVHSVKSLYCFGTADPGYYFRTSNPSYYYGSGPNMVIDISDTFESKLETMFKFTEFKFQKRSLRAIQEAFCGLDGARTGVKYAEVFRQVHLNR